MSVLDYIIPERYLCYRDSIGEVYKAEGATVHSVNPQGVVIAGFNEEKPNLRQLIPWHKVEYFNYHPADPIKSYMGDW